MTITDYLTSFNLSDGTFARLVGVDRTTVLRWRRGEKMPRPKHIAAILKATGGQVSLADWRHALPDGGAS